VSTETFLSIYQKYAAEITDASPDYHLFMGLSLIGLILKNRVFFPWGDTRLYPNIWIILLGESTVDHKSTAIMIPHRLADRYDHLLSYPNEFSYERMVVMLANRPCGVFLFDEFKTFLGLLNRDYMAGSRGFLASMYDAPYNYKRELSSGTFEIKNPAVSIWTATTTAWFTDNLKESDIEGGLIPRFIIVRATRKGKDVPLPPMADKEARNLLQGWMTNFQSLSGAAYMFPDARKIHDRWYNKMREWRVNRFGAFVGRLQAYLIKFAMIIQVNDTQSLKITPETMEKSVKLITWLFDEMRKIEEDEIVTGAHNKDIQKIKRYLSKTKNWMSRSQLLRATHLSSWQFNNAIKTMSERDEVLIDKQKSEGTKPIQIFRLEVKK